MKARGVTKSWLVAALLAMATARPHDGACEMAAAAYTNQILTNASKRLGDSFVKAVETSVASRELNVRQILAKVSLGEADAGFVYRTDALAGGDRVRAIEIPPDLNVIAEYPIAPLTAARHAALARRWIDLVLSERGRAILTRAGFRSP
jgi:molybdate transport system substrate-binding protein